MQDIAAEVFKVAPIDERLQLQKAFPHIRFPAPKLRHCEGYRRARRRLQAALSMWSFVRYPSTYPERGIEMVRLRRITCEKVVLVKSSNTMRPRVVTYTYKRSEDRVEAVVPEHIHRAPVAPLLHYVTQDQAKAMTGEEKRREVMLLERAVGERNAVLASRLDEYVLSGMG